MAALNNLGDDGAVALIAVASVLGVAAFLVAAAIGIRLRRKARRNSTGGFASREASHVRYQTDFSLPGDGEDGESSLGRAPTMPPPPPLSGPRTPSGSPASMEPPPYSTGSQSWGSSNRTTQPPIPPPRGRKPTWSSISTGYRPVTSQGKSSAAGSVGSMAGKQSTSGNTVSTGTRFSTNKRASEKEEEVQEGEEHEGEEIDSDEDEAEGYDGDDRSSYVNIGPRF